MIEKQSQDVGSNSTAIQAKGDVTINNGLQLSEVKELCLLFLQQNFPKLREEAVEAAKKNVEAYVATLQSTIAEQANKVDPKLLKDPDIQASINDSVQAAARKGEKANFSLLAELVTTRMRAGTTPILSIVADEAIRLVPRLTPEQIAYLALSFFLKRIQLNANSIEAFDIYAKLAIPIVGPAFNLSNANILHTEYVGATSLIEFTESAYYSVLKERYKFLSTEENLHDSIKERASTFYILCEQYRISKIYNVTLTSVGELIAIMAIRDAFPTPLDVNVWIN
jgi:hypothetical protein